MLHFTAMELNLSGLVLEALCAGLFEDSDKELSTSDDMDETVMIVTSAHPLVREMRQNIRGERLTLDWLQREKAEAGLIEDRVDIFVATRLG